MSVEQNGPSYKEFHGDAKSYLRIAITFSIALNLFLYLGMLFLVYVLNDQSWILGWKPALGTAIFTAVYARLVYRWMMRLDAQFGSGRGWVLESQQVKLPERAVRR